ncbi:MAG: leucine--tRNA ligase, partial [Flavobacterium sp.]|nr:leucine--tRNA ligase [Flavobacterium sp.]
MPEVEKYLPTEDGQPPLGNATVWAWDTEKNVVVSNDLIDNVKVFPLELNTMPGWAGSSWYWMRYMDAQNESDFASEDALKYWENVDLYIGGSEHATGHLLYSRFWNKFLKDRGFAPTEEPFKKLINQGMILGMSAFVYRTYFSVIWAEEGDSKRQMESLTTELVNKYPILFSKSVIDKLDKNIDTQRINETINEIEIRFKNIIQDKFPEFINISVSLNLDFV